MFVQDVSRQRKIGAHIVLGTGLLAVLPILAEKFHRQFLPSPAWVSASALPSYILGGGLAVGYTWLMFHHLYRSDTTTLKSPRPGRVKSAFLLLSTPVIFYFLGTVSVGLGLPMVYALAAGAPTEVNFQVARVNRASTFECRNPIKLVDMPFGFDELCDFPPELRENLRAGDVIMMQGKGSAWGIFPETAAKSE